MSQSLTDRYDERIAGALSCYGRLVITGTLAGVCYADGPQFETMGREERE